MTGKLGRVIWALLVGGFVFGLAAPMPAMGATAQPSALLRLVHATPGESAVEAYVDGRVVISSMSFTQATPYVAVPAGRHRLTVSPTGGGPMGTPLIDERADFEVNQAYTVVAAENAGVMESLLLIDAPPPPAADRAYLRVLHASPDAPAVADVAVAGGPVLISNLAFRSQGGYQSIAPGTYRFEVRPAGTAQGLATTAPVGVAAGRSYTVVVLGRLGDNSFQAVTLADDAAVAPAASAASAPTTAVGVDPPADMAVASPSRMPSAGGGGAHPSRGGWAGVLFAVALLVLLAAPRWRLLVGGQHNPRG